MGVAGLIIEPHPPNFEKLYIFQDVQMMLKQFFDISTGFRFSKLQGGSVPSIPVAVLDFAYILSSMVLYFVLSLKPDFFTHLNPYIKSYIRIRIFLLYLT